jgi:glycosyltransferase involved in cell wall biosynthesis
MVPDIHERFNRLGWQTELFSLPKRIRNKGSGEVAFRTFDWKQYGESPIVQKYIQTYLDYEWWARLRLHKTYDLIHAHHPIAALVLKKQFPQTPVVMTVHSSFENELLLNGRIRPDGPEQRFLTSLYRELEATVERLVTASNAFKAYLGRFVDRPDDILVIPNGFDPKRFRPIPHENEVPQLVTLCRLVPAKGLDVLLRACARLKERGLKFVLHVIGDGPMREPLEQMAVELNIYEEIIFYGYVLHPEEFMPFFDIFVLPSRAEAFGNVFAEAALCCLVPIGTNIGGIAEQIEHGRNGLLVPVDDAEALADNLEHVISDPHYRYELARSAYEKAKKEYSMNRVIQQLKRLYASLVPES